MFQVGHQDKLGLKSYQQDTGFHGVFIFVVDHKGFPVPYERGLGFTGFDQFPRLIGKLVPGFIQVLVQSDVIHHTYFLRFLLDLSMGCRSS